MSIRIPITRRHAVIGAAAALAFPGAFAANNPKIAPTLKLLAGFPAGGNVDLVSRKLAEFLRGRVADAVIVDNKTGAAGRLVIDALKNGPKDGSQWLVSPGSQVVLHPNVYKRVSYDPLTDLVPIAQLCEVPLALAVGPAVASEVNSLKAYVEWVKRGPKTAKVYGSPAAGALTHFLGFLFERSAGLNMEHIPYRGSAPAIQDLLGGQIPAIVSPVGDMLQHLAGGKLRILAVGTKTRSPVVPDVPTFIEQGYPKAVAAEWFGLFAPAGVHVVAADRMSTAVRAASQSAALRENFQKLGFAPIDRSREMFSQAVHDEFSGWKAVTTALGFYLDE